jgi:pimeloyl-ACP methyl ester carboxylesterase
MKDLAKDMIELLDKIEWVAPRSVHIVGHSMGGMMAQEMVWFWKHVILQCYADSCAGSSYS